MATGVLAEEKAGVMVVVVMVEATEEGKAVEQGEVMAAQVAAQREEARALHSRCNQLRSRRWHRRIPHRRHCIRRSDCLGSRRCTFRTVSGVLEGLVALEATEV